MQMELARQSILIRELFEDYKKKNPVTDEAAKAEYDKFKAQATGTEYRARHILVEKEDEAKALIAQIKGGAKFEDLAKKSSKDTGSAENGGDLDFAKPESLRARVRRRADQAEEGRDDRRAGEEPVRLPHHPPRGHARSGRSRPSTRSSRRSSSAWSRSSMQQFQDELRSKAKTDFKFSARS